MKIRTEVRVGFLVLLTAGLAYVGFTYLKGYEIFRQEKIYYIRLERAEGLEKADPVIVQGFPVGKVLELELEFDTLKDGTLHPWVRVTVSIDPDIRLREGTRVSLVSTSILGERALELRLGTGPELPPHTLLTGEIALTVEEMVRQEILPVKLKAEQLLAEIDTLVGAIRYFITGVHREKLSQSISYLEHSLRGIAQTTDSLLRILGENRKTIQTALYATREVMVSVAEEKEQIQRALRNLADLTDTLQNIHFTTTLIRLRETLTHLDTLLRQVVTTQNTVSLLLTRDSLYWYLERAIADLDTLLQDMYERPYRYVHVSLIGPSPRKIHRWEKKMERKARKKSRREEGERAE